MLARMAVSSFFREERGLRKHLASHQAIKSPVYKRKQNALKEVKLC